MDTESPEEVQGPIFTSVVKSPFPISYVFPSTESVDFYVVTLIDVCVCAVYRSVSLAGPGPDDASNPHCPDMTFEIR